MVFHQVLADADPETSASVRGFPTNVVVGQSTVGVQASHCGTAPTKVYQYSPSGRLAPKPCHLSITAYPDPFAANKALAELDSIFLQSPSASHAHQNRPSLLRT